VIGRASIRDAGIGCAHRLIRKSLEPQNPRKERARHHPLLERKGNDVRPLGKRNIVIEHVLETAPRARLVAEVMLRDPNQSLADQPIVRIGPLRRQGTKPLRQCQSGTMPSAGGLEET
jgi:hypothetical protein